MLTLLHIPVIISLVVNYMRRITYREIRDKLDEKGIPEYAEMLKRKYGYDADARKRRLNPRELELINEIRQSDNTYPLD